jgi:hypothetical protein
VWLTILALLIMAIIPNSHSHADTITTANK